MIITLKGANDDFSAYDFKTTSATLSINAFIGHADHDWDSHLQDRMINDITVLTLVARFFCNNFELFELVT